MILIDTSVLIDFLNGAETQATRRLTHALETGVPHGITALVYQEALQGAATAEDFKKLKAYLDTQVFYEPKHGRASNASAARIYFDCRRAGITLTSTLDCLIAQTALEHDLALLHCDKDYERIQEVRPKLRFW